MIVNPIRYQLNFGVMYYSNPPRALTEALLEGRHRMTSHLWLSIFWSDVLGWCNCHTPEEDWEALQELATILKAVTSPNVPEYTGVLKRLLAGYRLLVHGPEGWGECRVSKIGGRFLKCMEDLPKDTFLALCQEANSVPEAPDFFFAVTPAFILEYRTVFETLLDPAQIQKIETELRPEIQEIEQLVRRKQAVNIKSRNKEVN